MPQEGKTSTHNQKETRQPNHEQTCVAENKLVPSPPFTQSRVVVSRSFPIPVTSLSFSGGGGGINEPVLVLVVESCNGNPTGRTRKSICRYRISVSRGKKQGGLVGAACPFE